MFVLSISLNPSLFFKISRASLFSSRTSQVIFSTLFALKQLSMVLRRAKPTPLLR